MKKLVKLAVIRKDDDTPCPFGLSIPFACKNVGETIDRMAPLSILGDEATEEEINVLTQANKTLMIMESNGQQCKYAGNIIKDKDAVECNIDSNAPGINSSQMQPSPFYSKVYNTTSFDGLYSYPLGYYGDNNISRNVYYGVYSLQGSEQHNLKKQAVDDLLIKTAQLLYALGQKDRFDYLRDSLLEIKNKSKNIELFEDIDELLKNDLSVDWISAQTRYDHTNTNKVLESLFDLRKKLMSVSEYENANKIYSLYKELKIESERNHKAKLDELKNKPKEEFSALGDYLYHGTYPEDAFAMLKTQGIYKIKSFSNASFTSDLKSAGKFGPVVFVFNAKKLQRRGIKKMHYLPDNKILEKGFTGTETYETGKNLYINEIYIDELEWAIPLPFKFEESLEKVIIFSLSKDDLEMAEKVKAKLEKASDVPVEIEFYPSSGSFSPSFHSTKLEKADDVAFMSKNVIIPINNLIKKFQQKEIQTKHSTKINYIKTLIGEAVGNFNWFENYENILKKISNIIDLLESTKDSIFDENIQELKHYKENIKDKFMSDVFVSDEVYLNHLHKGAFGAVKDKIINWAIDNIDKVIERSKDYDYFSWGEIIENIPNPFVIPKEILSNNLFGLFNNLNISNNYIEEINEVIKLKLKTTDKIYNIEYMKMPELINDEIYLFNTYHLKQLLGNENIERLGKERLINLYAKGKELFTQEERNEIYNFIINHYSEPVLLMIANILKSDLNKQASIQNPQTIQDIEDALDHIQDELPSGRYCFKATKTKLDLYEILSYDDYTSWGEFKDGELLELTKENLIETLNDFRRGFGDKAIQWLDNNDIPPIIIVDSKHHTCIGDGRGRTNLAVGLSLESLPVIILTDDENGEFCIDI